MSDAGAAQADNAPLIIGRYALFDEIASGGMATVHLGRLLGAAGFGRTVAVKRLHAQFTTDQDFVTMFMDEARIVARIRHSNVVPMVDIIESNKALFLVMEYVHGETFSRLLRACRATNSLVPIKLATAVLHGALLGLHAAHETTGVNGEVLDVVHRDVSPQNIIIGTDGIARMLDFGVAKAAGRAQVTREGQIKGKLAYMAPEQIRGKVDRRADVFAAAVVLWEALAGRRLHEGSKEVEIVLRVVKGDFPPPSQFRPEIPPELDAIVLRGLEIDPEKRYQNAQEMADDLEQKVGLAPPRELGAWVERLASTALQHRAQKVVAMEKAAESLKPIASTPPAPPPSPHSSAKLAAASDPNAPPPRVKRSGEYAQVSSPPLESSNTATPAGTDLPSPPPEHKDLAPFIALLSFFAVLAIVGAVLGGWSLYAREMMSAAQTSQADASAAAKKTCDPPSTLDDAGARPTNAECPGE